MPKGCIFSLLGSLLTMVAGAIFFIQYSVDYSQIELTSLFDDIPFLRPISWVLLIVGAVALIVGLLRLFFGRQEEENSVRGGLIADCYTDDKNEFNKI